MKNHYEPKNDDVNDRRLHVAAKASKSSSYRNYRRLGSADSNYIRPCSKCSESRCYLGWSNDGVVVAAVVERAYNDEPQSLWERRNSTTSWTMFRTTSSRSDVCHYPGISTAMSTFRRLQFEAAVGVVFAAARTFSAALVVVLNQPLFVVVEVPVKMIVASSGSPSPLFAISLVDSRTTPFFIEGKTNVFYRCFFTL